MGLQNYKKKRKNFADCINRVNFADEFGKSDSEINNLKINRQVYGNKNQIAASWP